MNSIILAAVAGALVVGGYASSVAADPVAGKKVFEQCAACHSLEKGVNKVGPSLHGIVGRRPGGLEGYDYSKWMVRFGEDRIWDERLLVRYLESPQRVVIGTKMPFPGLFELADRADVIDYLKSFSR